MAGGYAPLGEFILGQNLLGVPPESGTGPPYPPSPSAGLNAIGVGGIGSTLSIGDIPLFDWRKTILAQYANSPIITAIIENVFNYLDQTANLEAFYDLVFNIDTAQGYGLDVWGRILGVTRLLQVADDGYFGWSEGVPGALTWNQGRWYSGATLTSNFALADKAFRMLLLAKAAANITDGSIPSINAILLSLFPNRGNCYVREGRQSPYMGWHESTTGNTWGSAPWYSGELLPRMTMQYCFDFALSPVEIAIVEQSGVLPKPVGVSATVVINP